MKSRSKKRFDDTTCAFARALFVGFFVLAELCWSRFLYAEPLPLETFCRAPSLTAMRLAPDGKHLAAISSEKGRRWVLVSNLESGQHTAITNADVWRFVWVNNQRLLCYAGGRLIGGVFAINIDGTQETVLLRPILGQVIRNSSLTFTWLSVLQLVPEWPDSVLTERAKIRLPHYEAYPEVGRLNFFTGKWTREEKNPGKVVQWLADRAGNVRAAIARKKDFVELLYRASKQHPWRVINRSSQAERDIFPFTFNADATQLYVASHNGGDLLGLYSLDPETGKLGQELWRDEKFDLAAVLFSSAGPRAALYEAERFKLVPLDPAFGKLQANIQLSLPDTVNVPIDASRDGRKMLYLCISDRDPGSYYLVDTVKGEFGIVGRSALWIQPDQMAKVQPIEYAARDGLMIHGYLTLPPAGTGTNLPLIVVPHGGPRERDHWEFDPEVQFFANRGYAVLQINFRGSTGFGLAFMRAGFREWGGKMQDDLTDAVNWAVSKRIADKSRVAIYGASYGGYAALMGLIKTPGLFRCAISYAGVTDVRAITHRAVPVGWSRREFERVVREQIGDYRADKDRLEAISPKHLVDKIHAPILLAYGGRDPIVDVEQGRTLAKALQKQHKKVELIIEENEGHGFYSEAAKSNLFHRIELFLNENLGK